MKSRIKLIVISILLILLSGASIYTGIYFYNLSQTKSIVGKAFKQVGGLFDKYFGEFEKIDMGDNFTLDSTLKFQLESEYYKNTSQENQDSLKRFNYINNLNRMNTRVMFQQDKDNRKLFMSVGSNIDDEIIINAKRLIDNSTEYYYLGGAVDNYVSNGSCNYFETLSDGNTIETNVAYLRDYILESFVNNLDDEYIETYQKSEIIDGKSKNVSELIIKFTNKSLHKLFNNILKDLKNDTKANQILSNSFKDFSKYKIGSEKVFLDKNEYYMLHIYSSRYLHEPLKYELTHMIGDKKTSYQYEIGKNTGVFYYLENDQVKYEIEITYKNRQLNGKIKNSGGRDLGNIDLEIDKDSLVFNYHLEHDKIREDLSYSSKYQKEKNNIINNKTISFKKLDNNVSKLNGTITLNSTIVPEVKIMEETSKAILSTTLTDEVKGKIDNYWENIKNRLER